MQPKIFVMFAFLSVFGTVSAAIGQQTRCGYIAPNGLHVPETKAGIANFANGTAPFVVKFKTPFCRGATPIVVLTPYKHGSYSIVDSGYFVQNVSETGFEIVVRWAGGSGDANISLTGWVAVEATEDLPGYSN